MATTTLTSGSGNWTAPANLTGGVVQVELFGGGGGGGDDDGATGGGGGGGGAYCKKDAAVVVAGNSYAYVVGGGGAAGTAGGNGGNGDDSTFTDEDAETYIGGGGNGGVGAGGGGTGGNGGVPAATSSYDTGYNGGNGANGGLSGGGGGSSAGTGVNGNNGTLGSGGPAPIGGAAGGNGGLAPANGSDGDNYGGAGGGSGAGTTAGAGAGGKIVLTWSESAAVAGIAHSSVASKESGENSFPGAVIFSRAPYGEPPAATPSAAIFQYRADTAQPEPFGGSVIALRPAMGETPPPPENGVPPRSYRPVPDMLPDFPGAVLTALQTPFGLSPQPANSPPVQFRIEAEPPPPFSGSVLFRGGKDEQVEDNITQNGVIRTEELPESIRQPIAWSGVHEPPAVNPAPVLIRFDVPTPYEGSVVAYRNPYGVPPDPSRPMVVRNDEWEPEAGRVLTTGKPDEQEQPPPTIPSVIAGDTSYREVSQPVSWGGIDQRDAPFATVAVVRQIEEMPFEGRVSFWSNPYGVSADPSRPVVVQQSEGYPGEAGSILFSRTVEPEPVQLPRVAVVSLTTEEYAGRILFSGGYSAPVVVAPFPMIVAGDTRYPEVGKPFFGYGWRTGTSAPSGVTPGNPVALTGYDDSAVSLTSEDCVCR